MDCKIFFFKKFNIFFFIDIVRVIDDYEKWIV